MRRGRMWGKLVACDWTTEALTVRWSGGGEGAACSVPGFLLASVSGSQRAICS